MVYGHLTMVGSWAGWQNTVTSWIYSFHIPLFLLVSGMFFSMESDSVARMKKVLLRIGVPYALFISVYLVGLILIQHIGIPTSNAPPGSVLGFVRTVLFYPYGGYWFLHSLLLIQLALLSGQAVVAWLKPGGNPAASWLWAVLILLGLSAFGLVLVRTILYFLVGLAAQTIAGRAPKASLLLGWGGVAFVWGLNHLLRLEAIRCFSFFEVAWCICILTGLWALADWFPQALGTRLLAWVGKNSLSILVFHSIFVVLLKPAAGWCVRIEPTGWLYSIGATALTTALCLLAAFLCDKARISRYLFATPKCYLPFGQAPQDASV